jgi:DNA-directed RNA polymerase subunit beta'
VADEKTGVSSKVVMDSRGTGSKNAPDLRPAIVIVDKKGKPIALPAGGEARYAISPDAILSVEDGGEVRAGDVLARIPTEGAKTRDITGGLPRVAELFEARKPKEAAVLAETDGFVEFGKDYKNKRRVIVRPKNEKLEPTEYLIPKGKHISVREGDYVEKGDYIVEGNPSPHDILRIKGMEELATYLVKEIQDVYRLQGVKINDKHIEVICRQMMQKLEIIDGGETTLIAGEHVDSSELESANAKAEAEGRKPADGRAILLGITKASLQTRSVFSAASFQETTRVLTEAAVNGKVDMLEGLKENVIVGRLIPAGTGGAIARLRQIATERDRAIQAEAAANEPIAALEAPPAAE